jgi:hypothetical protein
MFVPQTALDAYHDASAGIGLPKTSLPGLVRQRSPSRRQPGVLTLLQQDICCPSKVAVVLVFSIFRRRSMAVAMSMPLMLSWPSRILLSCFADSSYCIKLVQCWDMRDCKARNAPSNANRPQLADLQILK